MYFIIAQVLNQTFRMQHLMCSNRFFYTVKPRKKSTYRVNKLSHLNLSLVSVKLTFKGEVTLLSMQNFIRGIKPWWYMVHISQSRCSLQCNEKYSVHFFVLARLRLVRPLLYLWFYVEWTTRLHFFQQHSSIHNHSIWVYYNYWKVFF